MPTLMTEEELQKWILLNLGAPFWNIELTCDHLKLAIEDAKRWFTAKKGNVKMMAVDVPSGITEIVLIDDVDLVLDVASSQQVSIITPIADEFGFNQIVVGPGVSYNSYRYWISDVVQRLQYAEMSRRVFNNEFEWRQEGRNLFFWPKSTTVGKIILWYKSHTFTIEQLSEKDFFYLQRYALMRAKKLLGRIRSKYPDFPTAEGTTSLDGATLLEEASAEEEALNEEIKQSGLPMPIMTG